MENALLQSFSNIHSHIKYQQIVYNDRTSAKKMDRYNVSSVPFNQPLAAVPLITQLAGTAYLVAHSLHTVVFSILQ